MSRSEVTQFFDDYRAAFNRLDGDGIASCWHVPSGITHNASAGSDAALTWWPDDAPMRKNMNALCDLYRGIGYDHAEYAMENFVPMGERHAFALLHWTIKRQDGSVLQAFRTGYNLMRTEHGPKVILVTQFEEDIDEMKTHAAH
jgi:hypothetical protein